MVGGGGWRRAVGWRPKSSADAAAPWRGQLPAFGRRPLAV